MIWLESLAGLFSHHIDRRGGEVALLFVREQRTVPMQWRELGDAVYRCVDGLYQQGLRPGDHFVHWSGNRWEWIVLDLALQALGAVHVPIHRSLSAQQVAAQIRHSESRWGLVESPQAWESLTPYRRDFPDSLRWFTYETHDARTSFARMTWTALQLAGDPDRGRNLAEDIASSTDLHACCTLLYTSGTTGDPKGIMLSQHNLLSNAQAIVETFGEQPLELRLNFLPLSHIYARTCDVYTWLVRGSQLALTQSRDTIVDDCQRFRPTMLNGVPFFYERVRQKLEAKQVANQPGILQKTFGGQIRGCFSGGGALGDHTYDYYESQGIPLMQGYGLTETSPVISFSNLDARKRSSAGLVLRGVELMIADDGEILTRGPHVMLGYWKDSDATQETLRDGWLHTGDLGFVDDDGHLFITGRKTEMIVTATGKNVFPGLIEERLCRDPLILQACVLGDRRDCLAALIVPDPDVLRQEIKQRRLWVFSRKGAVRHPKIVALFAERIRHQLADLAHHEQVPLFRVLPFGFTPENGYLTAKLSLRRQAIESGLSREIDDLYAHSRKNR